METEQVIKIGWKRRQDHARCKKGFECCYYPWEKGWVMPVGQQLEVFKTEQPIPTSLLERATTVKGS